LSERVVVTRLIGGLGNQMFQYAAGRALALRHGVELKLDASLFSAYPKRSYELGCFPIRGALATAAELEHFGPQRSRIEPHWIARARRLVRINSKPLTSPVYRERYFHFDARVRDLIPTVYLEGYWQSEKYFADFAVSLREEFTPVTPMEPENAAIAARIDAVNAVSVHIRRGDYVNEPEINRYHGVCSADYYQKAVAYMAGRARDIHLFVFSDDQDWVYGNLHFALPTTLVKANPPERGFRDMQLMARCRHHIVANSSFSWWGAWLNSSRGKIVVAPRRWFAGSANDTRDLLPEDWVRV
jgi:hypothetical protein